MADTFAPEEKVTLLKEIMADPFKGYPTLSASDHRLMAMLAKGLTQPEVAEVMGHSRSWVAQRVWVIKKVTGLDGKRYTIEFVRLLEDLINA